MEVKTLGTNIPRADKGIIKTLLSAGLIYVGEDNQLHVREQKNIPVPPTKANKDIE